jgi:TolB protein
MQNQHSHGKKFPYIILLLSLIVLLLTGCDQKEQGITTPTVINSETSTVIVETTTPVSEIPSLEPSSTPDPQLVTPTSIPEANKNISSGTVILAKGDGLYTHLFIYDPNSTGLIRLTNDNWDDMDPSLSPDKTKVAFASDREGQWDIYVLDLRSGQTSKMTESQKYDGKPTWSPDGQYLMYQTLDGDNLDLLIQSITDPSASPIQLTSDAGDNFDPSWSPDGRNVAFISNRNGQNEIWLADLQALDDRFSIFKSDPQKIFSSPSWAPDGKSLAWCEKSSEPHIMVSNPWDSTSVVKDIGVGCDPVWSSDGSVIMAQLEQPNNHYLVAYRVEQKNLFLSPVLIDTMVQSFDWADGDSGSYLNGYANVVNLTTASTPMFTPTLSLPLSTTGRKGIVALKDVTVDQAYIADSADEAFNALRQGIGIRSGWDYLASLESAYLPLTYIPAPGITQNWLYTGRAINVNTIPIDAGWMTVTREDFSGQTYWRLWIKCLKQDGSCGVPMTIPSWDFSSRFDSDPTAYENGGKYSTIQDGYWIDFTELANRYGWQRIPSQADWRYYYPGIFFNQLVYSENLSWEEAMLDIYPADAFSSMKSNN